MSITKKAMLVELNISQCTFRKLDKQVTEKVTTEFHAAHDAGRFNKCLIAKENYREIFRAANQARTFHYANTLPWSDNGLRILPIENYWEYTKKIGELKELFYKAVDEFLENYPSFVEQARGTLGDLFNPMDYPGISKIQNKFRFNINFMPVPEAGNFIIDLNKEELENIKADIKKQTEDNLQKSIQSLWNRLYECVENMSEKLTSTRVVKGETKPAIFRDSLVDNLIKQCQMLTKLNLTNDPNLERMRQEIEKKLCGFEAEELRNNDTVRKETAKHATDILKEMASYCGVSA